MATFLSLPSLTQNRLLVYGATSTALAASVILNTAATRTGFYSAAVAIAKSNGAVMILANFCLFVTMMVALGLQRIFFGRLRAIEVEHLYDRSWYFVTESILALTMFREDFDAAFIVMFGMLLFLKCFHWIAADRVEWMDQLPPPGPPLSFHLRLNLLLLFLFSSNMVLFLFAFGQVLDKGVSGKVLFLAEYALLHVSWTNLVGKYTLNVYERWREVRDRRRAAADGVEDDDDDRGWEGKSMAVFYVDLGTDLVKLLTYLVYFMVILVHYGLPFNILRDVYLTFRSFGSRIKTLIQYRAATRNMDARYPDATRQEMDAMEDKVCIICREEMSWADRATEGVDPPRVTPVAGADGVVPPPTRRRRRREGDRPKKLSCNHVFHLACLKSWLERQQNCPTCRRTVMTQPLALGGAHGVLPGVAAIPPIGAPPALPAHPHPHAPAQPHPTGVANPPNGGAAGQPAPPQPGQTAVPNPGAGARIWGAPIAPPAGFDRVPGPVPPRLLGAANPAAIVPAAAEVAPGPGLTFEVAAFGYGLRIRLGQDAARRPPLALAGVGLPAAIVPAPAPAPAQPRLAQAVAMNPMFTRRPIPHPTPTPTVPSTSTDGAGPPPNPRSTIAYLAKVKAHFASDPDRHTQLLRLIQDYKSFDVSTTNANIVDLLEKIFPNSADAELVEGFSPILRPVGTSIKRNPTTGKFELCPPASTTAAEATPAAGEAGPSTPSSAVMAAITSSATDTDASTQPLDISNLTPREVAAQAALRRSARLNPTPSPPPAPAPSSIAEPAPTEIPLPDSPKLEPAVAVPILTPSAADVLVAELDVDASPSPPASDPVALTPARLPTLTPLYSPNYEPGAPALPHPHPQPFALAEKDGDPSEEALRRRMREGLERLEELEKGMREVRELLAGGGGGRGKGKGKEPAEGPRVAR